MLFGWRQKGNRRDFIFSWAGAEERHHGVITNAVCFFWSPHKSVYPQSYETTLWCREQQTWVFLDIIFSCIVSNGVKDGRLSAARKGTYIATLAVQTAA
jgi:hypothetical protein